MNITVPHCDAIDAYIDQLLLLPVGEDGEYDSRFISEISFSLFQKERTTKEVASQDGSIEPEVPISVSDIAPKGNASGRAVSNTFRARTCSSLSSVPPQNKVTDCE